MAAPTPTARGTPNGRRIDDGFRTLVTFARAPNIALWEKTVTPPGFDGGEKVETTTMHNVRYRTSAPRYLITLTDSEFTAAYDPKVYNDILAIVNQKDTITHRFPDGSTLAYFGFLQTFEPQECEEGTQPEATCMICPTNVDPATGDEASPVLTEVTGT